MKFVSKWNKTHCETEKDVYLRLLPICFKKSFSYFSFNCKVVVFFIRSCLWHHEHFEIIFPIIYNINRFQYCLSRRWWADGIVSTTYQSKTMKTFWKLSVGLWEGIGSLLTKFGADSWLNFIMINATIARYIPSFHALPSTTEGR